jgi:hypothetical protein
LALEVIVLLGAVAFIGIAAVITGPLALGIIVCLTVAWNWRPITDQPRPGTFL